MRVISVTVALCDPPILIVNPKLSSLVSAYLPATINGGLLCVVMTGGAVASTSFDIPSTLWVWDDMMTVWSFPFGHSDSLP